MLKLEICISPRFQSREVHFISFHVRIHTKIPCLPCLLTKTRSAPSGFCGVSDDQQVFEPWRGWKSTRESRVIVNDSVACKYKSCSLRVVPTGALGGGDSACWILKDSKMVGKRVSIDPDEQNYNSKYAAK